MGVARKKASRQCGAFAGSARGGALWPRQRDAAFAAAVGGLVWPRAAVFGAALWNFAPQASDQEPGDHQKFPTFSMTFKLDKAQGDPPDQRAPITQEERDEAMEDGTYSEVVRREDKMKALKKQQLLVSNNKDDNF